VFKAKLECADGGFSTQDTFDLVDIRRFRYLDHSGIKAFMEHYFKYMVNPSNGYYDLTSLEGTGLALDTRPKFFKAIMRRLGHDTTCKINFREFSSLLKP